MAPDLDAVKMVSLQVLLVLFIGTASCFQQSNMETVFQWTAPPLSWPNDAVRDAAVRARQYAPAENMPFGMEATADRLFFSFGNFRPGIPATLTTVPRPRGELRNVSSPTMDPYPSWAWQWRPGGGRSCDQMLVNVVRVKADRCGRLWAPDYGRAAQLDTILFRDSHCPPKLVVFDLSTDKPLRTYRIPANQYTRITTPVSVGVDDADGCEDAVAYLADSLGYSLTVYSWRNNTSWKINQPSVFGPGLSNPSSLFINIQGLRFPVPDGMYQVELSAPGVTPVTGRRTAFWHTLASFQENWIPAEVLRDPKASQDRSQYRRLGQRGEALGQEVVKAMSRRGVLFYTLARRDGLACWDSTQPYRPNTQAVLSQVRVGRGRVGDRYPGGVSLVLDGDDEEVWMLSTAALRTFVPGPGFRVNPREVNVVVYRGSARRLIAGTVCDRRDKNAPHLDSNRVNRDSGPLKGAAVPAGQEA